MLMLRTKVVALVNVLYWMPDYHDILQEFIWQTEDIEPEYPKVNNFLNYWRANIDAVIAEVQIDSSSDDQRRVRSIRKVWSV